jgi:putative membrane protein
MDIADRQRIADTIHAAEAKTSSEIVCVLAQTSSKATVLPALIAAVIALALPWLLVALTAMTVDRILLLQAVTFFVLLLLLSLPRVRTALVPARTRRAMAHHAAVEQFVLRGVARKKDRSGILIFVSLAERYARILADEGIAAQVPQAHWQGAIDALIGHMRDGRIADGFVSAINLCGEELARHFPRSGASRDELPDRVYVI